METEKTEQESEQENMEQVMTRFAIGLANQLELDAPEFTPQQTLQMVANLFAMGLVGLAKHLVQPRVVN